MCPQSSRSPGEAYITYPDNVLRRKIGANVNLGKIFTPEKIMQCQEMIDKTLAGFLQEMEVQLAAVGNEYARSADKPETARRALQAVAEVALAIKKSMEALDYAFGFKVAQSLYEYIRSAHPQGPDVSLIVCKHIAVLQIIIRDQIRGEGGTLGQDMLTNLRNLIKKARK